MQARIGILGAGQLSLMLCEAAKYLQISCQSYAGHIEDDKRREEFFSQVDHVLFESDFLPYDRISERPTNFFIPDLSLMRRLSDKIEQKKLLNELNIPTSEFLIFDPTSKLEDWVDQCLKRFKQEAVFKWARGGYDGKGVFIYKGDKNALLEFLKTARTNNVSIFCERKVSFINEISQLVVQSKSGEWAFYPLVISIQENGICRLVKGPAEEFGVSQKLAVEARAAAKKLGEAISLFGVFAVEMFQVSDTEFLVNEIAPRVHNTGHFSLNSAKTSQFENHLRACLGMPLGGCEATGTFGMFNLLGNKTAVAHPPQPPVSKTFECELKWYLKSELRPGRKMGHLNYWNFSANDFDKLSETLKEWESDWLAQL